MQREKKILWTKISYNSYALALCFLPFFFLFKIVIFFFSSIYFCSFPFSIFLPHPLFFFTHSLLVSLIIFFLLFLRWEAHRYTDRFVRIYMCQLVLSILYIYTYYTHIIPLCRRCSWYFNIKSTETKINNIVVDC